MRTFVRKYKQAVKPAYILIDYIVFNTFYFVVL